MAWSGWFDIGSPGGGFVGGPATVSRNPGVCNVYVRGVDNALWQRAYFDGQWHGWIRHSDGGVLASEPALGSMGPEHEHVFVRGTNGHVWQKYWRYEPEPVGEVSFGVKECVYGWTAAYHQAGTRVTVRIQLNPDAGISAATMDALRTTWRDGILATWSERFQCRAGNGGRQALTFDVQWVGANAHHVVRVRPGPERSNMGNWDTADTGNVAAHEFGHMLGHPDEYADANCPSRSPIGTGTVMEDNTETVARLYNRICTFHGSGHTPMASATPEPPEPPPTEGPMTLKLIDALKPEPRASVLRRLRAMGDPAGTPDGAEDAAVAFEISGGAPGERYVYRIAVRGNGDAERRHIDQTQPGPDDEITSRVDPTLARQVFAAASEAGLLDDAAPQVAGPEGGELLPDSMVAVLTVGHGDTVRRVVLPAQEPGPSVGTLPGEPADLPMATPMQLPTESVRALRPVLDALQAVEAAL